MRHFSNLILASCLVWSGLASVTAADFNLDSLLLESVGGETAREAVAGFNSLQMTGTIDLNGQVGEIDLNLIWPDRLRIKMDFGAYQITQTLNGDVAFAEDHNGHLSILEGFEKRELIKQCYLLTMAYLKPGGLPGDKAYLGLRRWQSGEYHAVDFYPTAQDTVTALFDQTDGMMVVQFSRQDQLLTVAVSEDFRTVQELTVPFKSITTASNAPLTLKLAVQSVEINRSIDTSLFLYPKQTAADFHFGSEADSIVLPISFYRGHIHIEGRVNGKTFWFILDSGASANMFNRSAMAGFEFKVVGSLPSVGVSGYEKTELVRIDSVAIGQLLLTDQVTGIMDLSGIVRGTTFTSQFGGILGHDFLSRFPIQIDYLFGRATVYNPASFRLPDRGERIKFSLTMNVPTVRARVSGVEGDFIIDLGNALGLIVHSEFISTNDLLDRLKDFEPLAKGFSGIGGAVGGQSAITDQFQLGAIIVADQKVLLPESTEGITGSRELAGNIGNPFLSQFRLLLDYRSQTIVLSQYYTEGYHTE